ncbi:hypothetical protein [Sporomusa acidovorans]|uniref:Uncharacterized protein n=1 Tax=Sporomusa acidovorans (strain ATCC 49682 / DSM 3132 / Mol) TaxID=1123286 RepID=A0ABZ3IZ96_SPOA4|nr:hypothetical protein [Sporomusa acidovorans]OZC22079.1 hypothetical protein SPACI_15970 [Sporomusa acidovorans DSM 3132]SDF65899.1 hypothetical protein SAMN04488499_10664 [Sporomusa acidovorans]
MLKVFDGDKTTKHEEKPNLYDKLMALAGKCDPQGNLPPEYNGEMLLITSLKDCRLYRLVLIRLPGLLPLWELVDLY